MEKRIYFIPFEDPTHWETQLDQWQTEEFIAKPKTMLEVLANRELVYHEKGKSVKNPVVKRSVTNSLKGATTENVYVFGHGSDGCKHVTSGNQTSEKLDTVELCCRLIGSGLHAETFTGKLKFYFCFGAKPGKYTGWSFAKECAQFLYYQCGFTKCRFFGYLASIGTRYWTVGTKQTGSGAHRGAFTESEKSLGRASEYRVEFVADDDHGTMKVVKQETAVV